MSQWRSAIFASCVWIHAPIMHVQRCLEFAIPKKLGQNVTVGGNLAVLCVWAAPCVSSSLYCTAFGSR